MMRVLRTSWSLALAFAGILFAGQAAPIMSDGEAKEHGAGPRLDLGFDAPPAIVWLEDTQGRRAGLDPAKPVGPIGQGTKLEEIPLSWVMDWNISSDEPETQGEQNPYTGWSVNISSKTPQVYCVHLLGMKEAVAVLMLGSSYPSVGDGKRKHYGPTKIMVPVYAGVTRDLILNYNPSSSVVEVTRVVTAADLLRTLDLACSTRLISAQAWEDCDSLRAKVESGEFDTITRDLTPAQMAELTAAIRLMEGDCASRYISSGGICTSLRAKVVAAERARERGNIGAAKGALKALMNELSSQSVERHVEEPALTILREEAEGMLKGLSGMTSFRTRDIKGRNKSAPSKSAK